MTTNVIAERVEIVPSLAELAVTVNAEHQLVEQHLASGLSHAVLAGDALLAARAVVPAGEWIGWLADNFEGSRGTAKAYMRVAEFREFLGEARSLTQGLLMLTSGGMKRDYARKRRYSPEEIEQFRRMKLNGFTFREIADITGATMGGVVNHVDPDRRREYQERSRAKRRGERAEEKAAHKALERQRQYDAAKKIGGGFSELYSRIRKAAEAAQVLIDTGETVEHRTAAGRIHRLISLAEDQMNGLL